MARVADSRFVKACDDRRYKDMRLVRWRKGNNRRDRWRFSLLIRLLLRNQCQFSCGKYYFLSLKHTDVYRKMYDGGCLSLVSVVYCVGSNGLCDELLIRSEIYRLCVFLLACDQQAKKFGSLDPSWAVAPQDRIVWCFNLVYSIPLRVKCTK
jgi:hypothetical protein